MNFRTSIGLARASGIKYPQFLAVLRNIERNYRTFEVPKRSGGKRTIVAPKPTLRGLQLFILENVLQRIVAHPAAHGYVAGRSTLTHAQQHLGASGYIKVDIKDFFPSITRADVFSIFAALGYSAELSNTLSTVCTLHDALPQGAPTSPALSNIKMFSLDVALAELCSENNVNYSRYADDLVFSSDKDILSLTPRVISEITSFGFNINLRKTFTAVRPNRMILTGVSVSTGVVRAPKAFKRDVRQQAYNLLRDGLAPKLDTDFDPFIVDKIIGKLSYWSWLEPHADFPVRYRKRILEMYSAVLSGQRDL